jgi:hypothetical protein
MHLEKEQEKAKFLLPETLVESLLKFVVKLINTGARNLSADLVGIHPKINDKKF